MSATFAHFFIAIGEGVESYMIGVNSRAIELSVSSMAAKGQCSIGTLLTVRELVHSAQQWTLAHTKSALIKIQTLSG